MKFFLTLAFAFFFSAIHSQNLTVQLVELSIKRPDINRPYEETEIVLSFQNIGREFLKVKSFSYSLKDDQGNDLVAKSKENLESYKKGGFVTMRSSDWEYFNYAFYNKLDAFGGKFLVYCAPSIEAKQIMLKGDVHVWVKGKDDKASEAFLNDIVLQVDKDYEFGGGTIRFTDNGMLTLDKKQYRNYKLVSDIPITSVGIKGQKKFQGIPNAPDEIFLAEGQESVTLEFMIPDTQIITIPVDLRFGIGL